MEKTWAVKREPIGNQLALKSGWSRQAGRSYRLWLCIVVVGCVLGNVTVSSVRTGPSAGGVLTVIRAAQQELVLAKQLLREPVLSEAEALLIRAWSMLKDRRYEESIVAAREAYQKVIDSSR
jgi:hypothetical protein